MSRLGSWAGVGGGAVLAFMISFVAARALHRPATASVDPSTSARAVPTSSQTSSRFRTVALADVPEAGSRDQQDLSKQLQDLGVAEDHAAWLALRLMAEKDFDASFASARTSGKLQDWANGAATLDLEKAITLIAKLDPKEKDAFQVRNALLRALGRSNPQLGLERMDELETSDNSWTAPQWSLFSAWAEYDRPAAMAAAEALPDGRGKKQAIAAVIRQWGVEDREEMLQWATGQDAKARQAALGALSDSGGSRDPRAMLDLAARYPTIFRGWGVQNIAEGFFRQGDAEGWLDIRDLPEGTLRSQLSSQYLSLLGEYDSARFFKIAPSLSPDELRTALRNTSYTLSYSDPVSFANLLVQQGNFSRQFVSSLMDGWDNSDPSAAFKWAEQNLAGKLRADTMGNALGGWFSRDPTAARAAYDELPIYLQANLANGIARNWSQQDPRAALQWAQTSLNAVLGDQAISWIFSRWPYSEPKAAAEASLQLSGAQANNISRQMADRLVTVDPTYAMQWALRFSEEDTRGQAAQSVFQNWGRSDPVTAAEHLDTLPAGRVRDQAVQGFVNSVSEKDPAAAVDWALSIGDEQQRTNLVSNTLSTWRQKDAAGADAYIQRIGDQALRTEILKRVNH